MTEATPKAILKLMDSEGLTIFHVKSHLQVHKKKKQMYKFEFLFFFRPISIDFCVYVFFFFCVFVEISDSKIHARICRK